MATADATVVYFTSPAAYNIIEETIAKAGEFIEKTYTGPSRIYANKPIQVIQYSISGSNTNNLKTFPSATFIPPVEQWSDRAFVPLPGGAAYQR